MLINKGAEKMESKEHHAHHHTHAHPNHHHTLGTDEVCVSHRSYF